MAHRQIKLNAAFKFRVFLADSTDGKTGKTGATLTVTIAKNGASSFSSVSPTQTELGNGNYDLSFAVSGASDTLGIASLRATATGADPIDVPNAFEVISYDPEDAVRLGLTALPNAVAAAAGGLPTFGTGTGQLNVAGGRADADVLRWNGTAVATPTTAGVPRVDVKAMEASVLTATAIAADAITAAKVAADVGTEIAAAVMAYAHIPGRTLKGAIKRLDQLITGKHTGLTGVLWRLFDTDGTTELVRAAQDTGAGTRETASVVVGD